MKLPVIICGVQSLMSMHISGFLSHVWVFVTVSVLGLCLVSQILSRFQVVPVPGGYVAGTLYSFNLSMGFCPGSDSVQVCKVSQTEAQVYSGYCPSFSPGF